MVLQPVALIRPTDFFTSSLFDTVQVQLRNIYSLDIRYGNDVFMVRGGYEAARLTLNPNGGTIAQSLNVIMDTLVGTGILGGDYIDYFTANNVNASVKGLGYQFNWNNITSMGEIVKRQVATPLIADATGWYLMLGYHFDEVMPHITFARERINDNSTRRFSGAANAAALPLLGTTINNVAQQLVNTSPYYEGGAGEQTSVTLGVRWDVYKNIAIKGEYQRVHPDWQSPGLFDVNPGHSVNIYSLEVDAIM